MVLSSAAMRKYYSPLFVFKIIHKRLRFDPPDFGLQLSNRSKALLFTQETIHRKRARNFVRFCLPEEWNALPLNVRSTVTMQNLNNYFLIGCCQITNLYFTSMTFYHHFIFVLHVTIFIILKGIINSILWFYVILF